MISNEEQMKRHRIKPGASKFDAGQTVGLLLITETLGRRSTEYSSKVRTEHWYRAKCACGDLIEKPQSYLSASVKKGKGRGGCTKCMRELAAREARDKPTPRRAPVVEESQFDELMRIMVPPGI